MCICVYIRMCYTYTTIYTNMYTCIYIHMYMYMYKYICTCVHVYIHICICVYMYMYASIHICMHIYMMLPSAPFWLPLLWCLPSSRALRPPHSCTWSPCLPSPSSPDATCPPWPSVPPQSPCDLSPSHSPLMSTHDEHLNESRTGQSSPKQSNMAQVQYVPFDWQQSEKLRSK